MSCPGGVSDFVVGNGVSIPTAGVGPTMSTPSGGVVTPVGIANGTTTYNYKVVAIGYHGELSAASVAFTTTAGASALGLTAATIATNGCVESNGVVTFTTTAAHNFIAGTPINIPRSSTGTAQVEGSWTIISVPSSTTFTLDIATLSNGTYCPSGGTAQVMAKNLVQWTIQPYAAMGYYIYRSIGAGSYALAGYQAGMDTGWYDWGFAAPPVPSYVPATPPASVTDGVFATTITGISGTNVTLAAAPTQSVTNATVSHDIVPNIIEVCKSTAFSSNNKPGGVIYLSPADPENNNTPYLFNSPLNMETNCPQQTLIELGAVIYLSYPIIPNISNMFLGTMQGGGGTGTPPSFSTYYTSYVEGIAQPLFLIEPGTDGITFQNMQTVCNQNYQTCFYHDQDSTGNNATTITYDNVFVNGGSKSQAFKLAGGFGFIFKGGGIGSSPSAWGVPPAMWDVVNFGVGNSSQQLAGIYEFNRTTMGGGEWLFDTEGEGGLIGCTGHGTFYENLDESSYYPAIRFACYQYAPSNISITRMTYADPVGGLGVPMVDVTENSGLDNIRIVEPFCAASSQAFFSGGAVGGVDFTSGYEGCSTGLPTTASVTYHNYQSNYHTYQNSTVQASGSGEFIYPMAVPSAPTSATVSAGGSISVGSHTMAMSAVDVNGHETTIGPSIPFTTTSGNQTVTVTPSTLPTGAIGWRPYLDGLLANITPCSLTPTSGFVLGSNQFGQSSGASCNNNPATVNLAGQAALGLNGLSASQVILGNQFAGTLIPTPLSSNVTWTLPSITGTVQVPGANTVALTADWTCGTGGTVSSCTSATIIGSGGGVPLTFTLPLAGQSYTLECDGVVGQATGATANNWNLLTATNGATNVTVYYDMYTAATAKAGGATTDTTSTTTTFNIGTAWTLGATGTKMPFHINARIQGASASGTVVSLQLVAPTVGDLVTIYQGASCKLF